MEDQQMRKRRRFRPNHVIGTSLLGQPRDPIDSLVPVTEADFERLATLLDEKIATHKVHICLNKFIP